MGQNGVRPHWFFWVLYVSVVVYLFVLGAAFGLAVGINPYLTGLLLCGGGILRVAYQAQRGNLYKRWWVRD